MNNINFYSLVHITIMILHILERQFNKSFKPCKIFLNAKKIWHKLQPCKCYLFAKFINLINLPLGIITYNFNHLPALSCSAFSRMTSAIVVTIWSAIVSSVPLISSRVSSFLLWVKRLVT